MIYLNTLDSTYWERKGRSVTGRYEFRKVQRRFLFWWIATKDEQIIWAFLPCTYLRPL